MSRVLVIDDERIVPIILSYALEAIGHEMIAADGGESGIRTALD